MDYPVVIRPLAEEDGGGYIAVFPDLPGCMSDGETPEEAISNAQKALLEWMDTARNREGFSIPQPGARAHFAQQERNALRHAISSISETHQILDSELVDLRNRIEEIEEMVEHSLAWSRFEILVNGPVTGSEKPKRLISHQ